MRRPGCAALVTSLITLRRLGEDALQNHEESGVSRSIKPDKPRKRRQLGDRKPLGDPPMERGSSSNIGGGGEHREVWLVFSAEIKDRMEEVLSGLGLGRLIAVMVIGPILQGLERGNVERGTDRLPRVWCEGEEQIKLAELLRTVAPNIHIISWQGRADLESYLRRNESGTLQTILDLAHGEDGGGPDRFPIVNMRKSKPRDLFCIAADVHYQCSGWPKMIGGIMTIKREPNPAKSGIAKRHEQLTSSRQFTAWLRRELGEEFAASGGSKIADLFETLKETAESYQTIEVIPHVPPLVSNFYAVDCHVCGGDALRAFLDLLNPASDLDRCLLEAAILSPMWGSTSPRPMFMLTSEHGRGAGKTSTAHAIGAIYGGSISYNPQTEAWPTFEVRLLSENADGLRVVLLDNLTERLENAALSAFLTTDMVSGKRLYQGEGRRPNLYTLIATANEPELGRDLLDRTIIIKVGAPRHDVAFEEQVRAFLGSRREELWSDIVARLGSQSLPVGGMSRFVSWDRCVFSKVTDDIEHMWAEIHRRRSSFELGNRRASQVREWLEELLSDEGIESPDKAHVKICSENLLEFFQEKLDNPVLGYAEMWRFLKGPLTHELLAGWKRLAGGRNGRGLIWKGEDSPDKYQELNL